MLDINNVIRISLTSVQRGLSDINTSALALFTHETPIPNDFGVLRVYLSPDNVAKDFGTDSVTARLANMIFAQPANIITGGGHLLIIPLFSNSVAQPATLISSGIDLSALPSGGGGLVVTVNGTLQPLVFQSITLTDIGTVQNSLNAVASQVGLNFNLIGDISAAQVILTTTQTGTGATITIGVDSEHTDIAPLLGFSNGMSDTGVDAGEESLKDALIRTATEAQYFGFVSTLPQTGDEILETASIAQPLDKIYYVGSADPNLIDGAFDQVKASKYTHTRCLEYLRSTNEALDCAAGYASRGLSCNFNGSNTVFTMHLKDIVGLQGDIINQTQLQNCQNNGIDTYPDLAGLPKVFTSGANQFYDQVYTRLALKLRIQIALFNYLATTSTKIPQTEAGIEGMKDAVRRVLMQFVSNGMLAPGTWNSATRYGNPEDHIRNIKDFGFYIYSQPIFKQSQSDREARRAPLIQIAAKEAGAVHSADIAIEVEA
jgi:hypothetical protein